jgi:serine/threonine-protein kinase
MLEALSCPNCGREVGEGDTFCATCGASVTPVPPAPDGTVAGLQLSDGEDLLLSKLREATVGEYEVRALLGRGGMASVFIAYDLALNRRVAIKAMHPGLLGDSGMRERFRLEARLSARLDHPNIVTVHAVKERAGIVFFDLKLIEGTSLDRIMRYRNAPLPVSLARWITAKIADALHYAHTEGVVHRDVKPANVMLDRRGDPTMTDFGIAKATESPHLTMTGAIVGTPAYMSPEQCLAAEITAASDQYSLGVMAYELLTGKVPFTGSLLTIQLGHVERTPPAPVDVVPQIPAAISDTVMRMMAKDPADRWPTLGAAGEALLEGLGASDTQMRRELGLLVDSMPGDVVRTFPPTPRTSTPMTFGSPATSAAAARSRVQELATAEVPTSGGTLEPTPVVSMEAIEKQRARRKMYQLGGVAAAGVGIVALIAMFGGGDAADTPVVPAAPIPVTAPVPTAQDSIAASIANNENLEVSDTTVSRVGLDPINVTIAVGDSLPLKATPYGPSGEAVQRRIRWSSGDTTVVRVGADGWIRGLKAGGPVFINAAAGGRIGVAIVIVQ